MKTIRKPNNKKVFRQYDSRWGYLPYPVLPSTLASSGCGCCAITHLVLEIDPTITPKAVQPFMKKYAVKGNGTAWSGIPNGMKHYDFQNVKHHATLASFYKELKKGKAIGVILFNKNVAPDGTQWTAGGHYIAVVGYGVSDDGKKHYCYTKDSGGRGHDGWYCVETSMKGCIRHEDGVGFLLWTCEVPDDMIILPARGYFKLGDEGKSVKMIQKFLKEQKLYKGKIGGHYRRRTKVAVRKFQEKYGLKVDGLFGEECLKKYLELKGKE